MTRYIDLAEGTTLSLPTHELSHAEIEALVGSTRFKLARSLSGDQYEISCINWVGQVPISRDLTIRVSSKVPVTNLFWMLDVAYSFKSFQTWDDRVELVESVPDLFTRLASMLAKRIHKRLQKGLHRAYQEQTHDLSAARGRIDVAATVMRSFATPRVVCDFSEHTADIPENQIPLFALHLISKLALTDHGVMDAVRRAHRSMIGAVSLRPVSGEECVLSLYSRLNEDYQPIHILSRFFIDHVGPALGTGDQQSLPFCVDMPRLFEQFVAEWLRRALAPEWRVGAKHRLRIQANMEMSYEIDLVIEDAETGRIAAVLDTKYKDTDRPSRDDVNQVIAYAAETGATDAFLIYPRPITHPFAARSRTAHIESLWIDLGARPQPDGRELLKRLRERLHSRKTAGAH